MGRVLLWVVGVLLALGSVGVVLLRVPAVQDRVVEAAVDRMVRASADELFAEDALRVLLCGTSSPMPHPDRAKPCTAVFAAGRFWVVDTGIGSWNRLALWRIPGDRIGAVFLTHFHSDHIGALGEYDLQTWVAGREVPLRVYGPMGVERVVAGFEQAYAMDARYRTAHHGADLMAPALGRMLARPFAPPRPGAAPVVILEEDGLRVTAFAVDHRPVAPAVGYRFDYRGRSVVVSGDTVKHADLIEAARGADVALDGGRAARVV